MSVMKKYNAQTQLWDSIVVGSTGPQGANGAQGAQGPQGPQGIAGAVVVTSSTRPNSPSDGLMIYETDTDRIAVYDGSSWVYKTPNVFPKTGMVLNVASTTKTDTQVFNTTTFTDITGLSVSITPSASSSKILVAVNVTANAENGNTQGFMRLLRGSTTIGVGDSAGSRIPATSPLPFVNQYSAVSSSFTFLDSPNTTSSVTYKLQVRDETAKTVYINRSQIDNDGVAGGRYISTITVMEIAG